MTNYVIHTERDEASTPNVQRPDVPYSSSGNVSPSLTPMDVPAGDDGARDIRERRTRSDGLEEREEALLDAAIEMTFPASDPIAVPSYDEAQKRSKASKGTPSSR